MSAEEFCAVVLFAAAIVVACVHWARLLDVPQPPTARALRKRYRTQRADLRRALKGWRR